ncbi:hypothetical protein BaRGS_00003521 [Batillaria attramentaria]|uniref:Uncharacterized protein n=1 Tax=Batillaria attramentaria TaxID=370345 RepID=A0ABD0M215_9CAEN
MDLNLRDTRGKTALIIACRFEQTMELVGELLEKGADPDLDDRYGFTALWWACHGYCVCPSRDLSTVLQTRVPRILLTLPWRRTLLDYLSPYSGEENFVR